jgi:RND family efflux transporter MFP subunit
MKKIQINRRLSQVLVIGILATFLVACSASKADKSASTAESENLIPVKISKVQERSLQIPIRASGIVATQTEVKLAFKTGGVIEQVYAQEGQTVGRGQLIAKLNLVEIQSQVAQAQLQVEKANRDFNRAKNLYSDSVATLEQLENATTGRDLSIKSLKIAEFNQQYSTIYAPITGKVLRKFAESGELISPGSPVILIGSTEQAFVVKVGLTDRQVVRVRLGDPATIQMDAHPSVTFKAFVSQIAQTATPATGTYEVELQVESQGLTLISGFVAQAEIQPQASPTYWMIPVAAMVEADGEKGHIYILNANKNTVEKRVVKIITFHHSEVAIQANLTKDDQIVTEGAPYLTDKAGVKVMK